MCPTFRRATSFYRGDDQFAQQRRYFDHGALYGCAETGPAFEIQGAHETVAGEVDLVNSTGRQPQRPLRWHYPRPLLGGDCHDAVPCEYQLGASVTEVIKKCVYLKRASENYPMEIQCLLSKPLVDFFLFFNREHAKS